MLLIHLSQAFCTHYSEHTAGVIDKHMWLCLRTFSGHWSMPVCLAEMPEINFPESSFQSMKDRSWWINISAPSPLTWNNLGLALCSLPVVPCRTELRCHGMLINILCIGFLPSVSLPYSPTGVPWSPLTYTIILVPHPCLRLLLGEPQTHHLISSS